MCICIILIQLHAFRQEQDRPNSSGGQMIAVTRSTKLAYETVGQMTGSVISLRL